MSKLYEVNKKSKKKSSVLHVDMSKLYEVNKKSKKFQFYIIV